MSEKTLKEALESNNLIILVGLCSVRYEGRAASRLGWGERLVIIKNDKSVLVHRPTGYEPVNWQPPNSRIEIEMGQEGLKLVVRRRSERLDVSFSGTPKMYIFSLSDDAQFEMYATEDEMKSAVLLQPEIVEPGFKPFAEERQVFRSGRIDLMGRDREGRLVILELKKARASREDIIQLQKYASSIERELGEKPRTIIAAPSISSKASSVCRQLGVEFRCLTPRMCSEILRRSRGLDRFTF